MLFKSHCNFHFIIYYICSEYCANEINHFSLQYFEHSLQDFFSCKWSINFLKHFYKCCSSLRLQWIKSIEIIHRSWNLRRIRLTVCQELSVTCWIWRIWICHTVSCRPFQESWVPVVLSEKLTSPIIGEIVLQMVYKHFFIIITKIINFMIIL